MFKKGDEARCSNYKGITLLSMCSKVYELILEQRLKKVKRQLDQSQSGFRKGRSIRDHIFTVKQLAEKVKDTNKTIYVAFIDFEKAFDGVTRNEIKNRVKNRNVNNKLRQDKQRRVYTE